MPVTDNIKPALINKQIALKGRFLIVGNDAGLEAGVRRFDIAVAVVDSDNDRLHHAPTSISSSLSCSTSCTAASLTTAIRFFIAAQSSSTRRSRSHTCSSVME